MTLPSTLGDIEALTDCERFCSDAQHQPGCRELNHFIDDIADWLVDVAIRGTPLQR